MESHTARFARFLTAGLGKRLHRGLRALHRGFVVGATLAGFDFGRRVEAMKGREILHDLHAAAMPVHVAEAADVHENVEAELLSRGKRTRHLVVLAAMAQTDVDDLAAARLARRFDRPGEAAGKSNDSDRK